MFIVSLRTGVRWHRYNLNIDIDATRKGKYDNGKWRRAAAKIQARTTHSSRQVFPLTTANYRNLISSVEESTEGLNGDASMLIEKMETANSLFKKVQKSQEATLDSKFFLAAGSLALEKAKALKMDGSSFERTDFLSRILQRLGSHEDPDWSSLYEIVDKHIRTPPSVDFMQVFDLI